MSLLLDNSKLSPFIFARSILSKLSNKDLLLALIVIIVWGLNFVVIKVGVADVPPFLLAGLRFLLVVFPLAFFLKAPKIHFAFVLILKSVRVQSITKVMVLNPCLVGDFQIV